MDRSSARERGAAGGFLSAISSMCRASHAEALVARPTATTNSSHRSVTSAILPAKLPIPDFEMLVLVVAAPDAAGNVYRFESFGQHIAKSATAKSASVRRSGGTANHASNSITVTGRKRRKEGVCPRNCAGIRWKAGPRGGLSRARIGAKNDALLPTLVAKATPSRPWSRPTLSDKTERAATIAKGRPMTGIAKTAPTDIIEGKKAPAFKLLRDGGATRACCRGVSSDIAWILALSRGPERSASKLPIRR